MPLVVVRTFSKTWSMAAARLGYLVAPAWVVADLEKVVLPYHLDAAKQLAGRLALAPRRRDGRPGQADRRRARAVRRRAAARSRSTSFPSGANFVLFRVRGDGAGAATGTSLAGPRRPRRAGARLLELAAARRLPAGHGRHAGGERPLPRRPRVRCSHDEPASRRRASAHDEGDVGRGRHRPRRHRRRRTAAPASRSTTTCSTSSDATAGSTSPSRPPGDLHIDTHHTVEDVAITLGEAFREALGDKAGIRRFASGLYPLDEALVEVALDISGRPFVAWDVEMPESLPLGNPAFDPQLAEHAVSSFATNAGLTLHVSKKAGRNVHHIIEATFKGLARSLRDAVRVDSPGGVPSTKGVL